MNDLLFDYAQLAQWQQGDEDNSRRLRRLRRRLLSSSPCCHWASWA